MRASVVCFACLLSIVFNSCKSPLFTTTKSPHEQYREKLERAGLGNTLMVQRWMEESKNCFNDSLVVSLPYRENGFFAAEIPRATALRFLPKQGQMVNIQIAAVPDSAEVFADLWKNTGGEWELLASADSSLTISYETDDNSELILRIQPELLVNLSYTLTIWLSPSLAFPVPGNTGKNIGSFWGDQRDGGARSHEGIDIFDKFRTPVIAAYNGWVTGVNQNNLGGKVVWLRPYGKDFTLYYAHLDSQCVSPMQRVEKGDTVGLMGNTGNARYTPTHLHFGIYTSRGAVDPLPYVQQVDTSPEKIKGRELNEMMRTLKPEALLMKPSLKAEKKMQVEKNTWLKVHSATGNYYLVSLPQGYKGFVPVSAVTGLNTPLKKGKIIKETQLLFSLQSGPVPMVTVPVNTEINVLAYYGKFCYVRHGELNGWVETADVNLKR